MSLKGLERPATLSVPSDHSFMVGSASETRESCSNQGMASEHVQEAVRKTGEGALWPGMEYGSHAGHSHGLLSPGSGSALGAVETLSTQTSRGMGKQTAWPHALLRSSS